MKAVTNNQFSSRDEQDAVRLYFLLSRLIGKPRQFFQINNRLYFIELHTGEKAILKQFRTINKLKKQIILTDHLTNNSFETYTFLKQYPILQDKQTNFAFIQYIEKNPEAFTYSSEKNRKEGLHLLNKFHQLTQSCPYIRSFPSFDQFNKFVQRYEEFKNNLFLYENHPKFIELNELLDWAKWSLKKMDESKRELVKEPTLIVHGDVANHNFLNGQDNKLYLIDFDLSARAMQISDYLQYAGRILPYINWNLGELHNLPTLQHYVNSKWFLAGLAYPSDLLREINQLSRRIVKNKFVNKSNTDRIYKLLHTFEKRQKFFTSMQYMVK